MAEKISVSSRASVANTSRFVTLPLLSPASIKRKNKRLSFASFRQIFARIRKSFLLRASSASIQLAATEPDARTSCRTSSVLLTVLGNCFTNPRTDSANRNVRSSRSRGLAPSSILDLGFNCLFGTWVLGFWNLWLLQLSETASRMLAPIPRTKMFDPPDHVV